MSLLTDRTFATGVTLDDLIHIVITGDTSQNPAGSSFKATIGQVAIALSGTSGTSGTSGSSGSNGTSGTSGSSGANGTNGTNGTSGTSPNTYQGSFYDTADQTGLANTVLTMSANTSDSWNNGVSLSANTRFVIQNSGIYNLAFSAQMVKTGGNSSTHGHIWLSQNGSDVVNSASQIGFPSNSVYVVAAWNFFFETTTTNEYVELKWQINSNVDNQLFVKYETASGSIPAIPSLIVTINKVG